MIKKEVIVKYSKHLEKALNELTEIFDLQDKPKINVNDINDVIIDAELFKGV